MKQVLLGLAFSVLFVFSAMAQSRTVTGTVTSEEEPDGIPGVNISIPGTTTGAITDLDGSYSIAVPAGADELVFSFVGFESQTIQIGNRSVIDVVLVPDVKTLGEVVVVGYGTQSERFSVQ